ncbi:uncharacterized protein LOC118736838 [Rhagoletis pomonella]|uniref:uncharacterized protein LOC118736838 n=1 Tax=Rhagoletis pomonella TaxID=28610 RepID=UPI00177AF9AD|nr:uncharacterized protein LOC118736838 [Rhagoletis pomonella]XP_036322789.1 uncharacterized protein LOC118736838 [Rhagoletis pomonella]
MAGVPPIAPLLCSTPPPIDFGEEDDDSGLPPTLTLEDDDEYGDFAFAADINENATNTDIPSLPRTPLQFELSSSTTSGFTDVPPSLEECGNAPITPPPLQTEHDVCSAREEVKLELIEAINYNVVSRETNQERISDGITNVDETSNTNDSVTSHPQPEKDNNWVIHNLSDTKITNETCAESESLPKFAHTTDAITTKEKSGTENVSILSNGQDIKAQPNAITIFSEIPPPLTQLVLLEDIADDSSDEECHGSPKKSTISTTSPFTSSADINSADFFAIHVVGAPSSPKEDKPLTKVEDINMNSLSNHDNNISHEFENITKTTPYGGEELNDDFGDFADFESATEITNPTACPMKTADSNVITKSDCNDVKPVGELPVESTTQNNDDENEFDDFQDFCSAPTSVSNTKPIISSQNSEGVAATCNDGIKKGIALNENSLATLNIDSESQAKEVENSDDDDFGDFEEASLAIPTSEFTANTAIMNTHTPPATSGNISGRIGSVLKLMFPPADESVDSDKERTAPDALSSLQLANGTLPFESIEAAKALEFQWPQSEIRHALVRSIGIDSRNILFGENWNPSMPRFAANLSFNPLKPLKPQTVNPSTTTAGIDSEHYSNGSDVSNYSMKTDVPDVEFDWQSAGLVNPLDGVKGETNTRETETVHSSPPVARLDTPDDQHQSHTTFTNVDDNISEALSNNDTKLTLTPTKDICPAPLTLDQPTYQLTAQDQSITISTNCISGSNTSNSRSYESRKTLSTLRLGGANIVDNVEDDETVVTSTYAGPLKETHIYTPSKTEMATTVKTCKSPTNGNEPIDFDYEIAAAGIIIDEKVVKKEYRDVEYNPGFSLEMVNEYAGELPTGVPTPLESELSIPVLALTQPEPQHQQQPNPSVELDTDEFADFTEFQSVPPPTQATVTVATASYGGVTSNPSSTIASAFQKESNGKATNINAPPAFAAAISKAKEAGKIPSRTSSPSIIDNMILSPAILLPQAIPMNANNTVAGKATPSIEWGDTTANINPDELARIEELFPQPKITAAKDANTSQKSSPTHSYADNHAKNASISISAAVAMKEQDSTLSDDYWSEFVSVPVTPQLPNNAGRLNNNNNNNYKLTPNRAVDGHVINSVTNSNNAVRSPRHHQQHVNVQRTLTPTAQRKPILHTARGSVAINSNVCNSNSYINSNSNTNTNSNDDDWSDFVSSTPALAAAPTHSTHYMPTAHAPQFNSAAWQNANFYNNPLGLYHQQLSNMQTRAAPLTPQQQQLQLQQQIHIMQDFSTAPVTARPNVTFNNSNNAHINSMQHSNSYSPMQVGNARVAPSISLIPDLGFVAPAMPVHTAFINVLPKTSFNSKK